MCSGSDAGLPVTASFEQVEWSENCLLHDRTDYPSAWASLSTRPNRTGRTCAARAAAIYSHHLVCAVQAADTEGEQDEQDRFMENRLGTTPLEWDNSYL